jgi:hypothetical protein
MKLPKTNKSSLINIFRASKTNKLFNASIRPISEQLIKIKNKAKCSIAYLKSNRIKTMMLIVIVVNIKKQNFSRLLISIRNKVLIRYYISIIMIVIP